MKFISLGVKTDPTTNERSISAELTRKDLDYIGEGLTVLLNKPYSTTDQAQLARFQALSLLSSNIYKGWEATDPKSPVSLEVSNVEIVIPETPVEEPIPEEQVTDF